MRAFLVIFAVLIRSMALAQPPIPPPGESDSASPQVLAAARGRGEQSAQADIHRGVLRILDFGEPLPPDIGHRVDRETRFPLESIWGCVVTERFVAEVEAYNSTMRAWHAKHTQ